MVNTSARTNDMDVLGYRGCCIYPNGKMGIAAVCVSVIGFILATFGTYTCKFFTQEITDSYYGTYEGYIGLFSFGDSELGCVGYGSFDVAFTGTLKFARAMAILATILGSLALVGTLSLSCMSMPNLILNIVSILYLISALCVILTLVAKTGCLDEEDSYYGTSFTCNLGAGAALAIVAPLFYLASAVLVHKIPLYQFVENETKPTQPEQAPGANVMIEITEFPDGTKKTVKTTIDENGNKIVEETIEEPSEDLYPEEVEEEEEVVEAVFPDGSMKTTRTTFDEYGRQVVTETMKPAGKYGESDWDA